MAEAPTDIAQAKKALRQEMLARRQATNERSGAMLAESFALHFSDHPILAYCNPVAGYHAFRGEVDLMPVFRRIARHNKTTALPRIDEEAGRLRFYRWAEGELTDTDRYGIHMPRSQAEEVTPQLVLVPLLAFDAQGGRLGYGGGYYDRTIHALRTELEQPPYFVGVAYSIQEVDKVPRDVQDAPLDGILTELGVSLFTRIAA